MAYEPDHQQPVVLLLSRCHPDSLAETEAEHPKFKRFLRRDPDDKQVCEHHPDHVLLQRAQNTEEHP